MEKKNQQDSNSQKQSIQSPKIKTPPQPKDEMDSKIEKMYQINQKLMTKMKEMNLLLENTLESANNKKLAKMNKESNIVKTDLKHKLQVKEGELSNTRNQV